MTSSGQVLFAVVILEFGCAGGGWWRWFGCQPEPVGPVSDPRDHFSPQVAGESGTVVHLKDETRCVYGESLYSSDTV